MQEAFLKSRTPMIFPSPRHAALSLALALCALAPISPFAQSMPAATPERPHAKAIVIESLRLAPDAAATPIRLDAPAPAAIEGMKRGNAAGSALKRLQIGINRDVSRTPNANAGALSWIAVDGGYAAHWSITSAEARALRVGLVLARSTPALQIRFSGSADTTVYGPFSEADTNAAGGGTYWSPVLLGDTATVELFVPGDAPPRGLAISVAEVSHLVVSPAAPQAQVVQKAVGDAGFCEIDLACRAAGDAALAAAGTAVARMSFSDGTGTFLCTGTLLNSAGGQFVPYFYTAAHCIGTQAAANTLTTWWFFDASSCGSGTLTSNNQQVTGGATLLFANDASDISFMRLRNPPPAGVTFAAWDASTLSNGTALTAIHHPAGDLKKVSLGTFGGYVSNPPGLGKPGSYIRTNWNSISTGVTEGGSSGSGIFTHSGGGYAFRGGLLGGPSSCFASSGDLNDYYSRFDVAFQNVSQFLQATAPTNYTALWYAAPAESESGWGINVAQQGDVAFATLFTYDTNGAPMWLVMSKGERQGGGDTFSGPLYRATGSPFNQSFSSSATKLVQVGTMTLSFAGESSGTLSYSVNGVAVTKSITKELFAPTGAAKCAPTTGGRGSAANYTDLWYAAPAESESGWGINLTQQGSVMFATLFAYDTNGQGMWLVMSAGQRQADGSFSGALYQTHGNGAFNAQPWPGVTVTQVGTMTLRFDNGENATLSYTVNGTSVTKAITRQVFSTPVPLCTG
jgi:hypothetical protein